MLSLFYFKGFSEVDLLKIWKGLFYCMWMSDKPLIQVYSCILMMCYDLH